MKKTFIFLALICLGLNVVAQRQPSVGDTMYAKLDSFYFQDFRLWEDWITQTTDDSIRSAVVVDDPHFISTPSLDKGGLFRRFYTDHPIRIIGIAASVYSLHKGGLCCPWIADSLLDESNHCDTTRLPEFLRLLDAQDGQVVEVADLLWEPSMPCRYYTLPLDWATRAYCDHHHRDTITVRMYERYFDKPFVVDDSFYVGGTDQSGFDMPLEPGRGPMIPPSQLTLTWYPAIETYGGERGHDGVTYRCHAKKHFYLNKRRWPNDTAAHWEWLSYFMMPLIYPLYEDIPIISDSATCPPTDKPELMLADPRAGTAFLQWPAHYQHASWEIGHVPLGLDFDSLAILTPTTAHNAVPLTGLQPGESYEVRVRGLCLRDSTIYGPWSDSLIVSLPIPQGIDPVDDGEILAVEVYDLLGRLRLRATHPAGNQLPAASHLPSGPYLLRTITPQGVSTRKILLK